MLSYNEITQKKVILMGDEPYEVLSSHVFRKQQRKPVNQTKLRSLKTGSVTENTFHQNDKVEEADLETCQIQFIYHRNGEWWFMDPKNPRERFPLSDDVVGAQGAFLKENTVVDALKFNDEIIIVKHPIKAELAVTEAPPDVRGNTAQGGNKQVTLETGAVVNVPMFIKEGDVLRINTETGAYVERV